MPAAKPHPLLRVFPGTGFISSYAGTEYLLRELKSQGIGVEILMRPPEEERARYLAKGLEFRFGRNWTGSVPPLLKRFARAWERASVLAGMLGAPAVLITESAHLREASLAKKIRGNRLLLVHYSQELMLRDELPESGDALFYEQLSRFADITIDVESNRAAARKVKMHLAELPLVLPNTLPLRGLPARGNRGALGALAGAQLPEGKVIVLYTGILAQNKPFSRIAEAFSKIQSQAFLVAFCGGDPSYHVEAVESARKLLEPGTWAIQGLVPRAEILSCSWEADIGVVDYSPSLETTTNQRFCAPTKLYEYMAAGLAIAGSDNPSLVDVVEKEKIGYCAKGGSGSDLGEALLKILSDQTPLAEIKRRSRQLFEHQYCYEKACAPIVAQIAQRIRSGQP